jgi:hypothetical protein
MGRNGKCGTKWEDQCCLACRSFGAGALIEETSRIGLPISSLTDCLLVDSRNASDERRHSLQLHLSLHRGLKADDFGGMPWGDSHGGVVGLHSPGRYHREGIAGNRCHA